MKRRKCNLALVLGPFRPVHLAEVVVELLLLKKNLVIRLQSQLCVLFAQRSCKEGIREAAEVILNWVRAWEVFPGEFVARQC